MKTGRFRDFLIGLCLTLFMAGITIYQPNLVRFLDFRVYDAFLKSFTKTPPSSLPVLVVFDEKSLQEQGQWPWPRYRIALLLEKIRRLEPAGIGVDILFPEPDRMSPKVMEEMLWRDLKVKITFSGLPDGLEDNDRLLAGILQKGPFVLSYGFLFHEEGRFSEACGMPPLKMAILSSLADPISLDAFIKARSVVCDTDALRTAAANSGFVNTIKEDDNLVRRYPLFIYYQGKPYPSLALATLMQAVEINQVALKATHRGALSLRLGKTEIPVDESGYMWVKFRKSAGTFETISATDLLNDKIPVESLRGKVVLVGTKAIGIGDMHTTPMGTYLPGVEIQATVVDNILQGEFVLRPGWALWVELLMVLLGGGVACFFLTSKRPVAGVLTFLFLSLGFIGGAICCFKAFGIFISPLLAVMTLAASFVLLIAVNLKRAILRGRDLQIARIKAEEVSRFKSAFLANMSHEIRTPMNAIIGLSYLALQTKLSPKQSDYLNKIQSAGKMLLGIINDILDYSKIEARKLTMEKIPFSLDDVLKNLSSLISLKTAEKGLDFLFTVDSNVPNDLVGDPLRLGQILTNLAGNAVKFTERGEIVVAVRRVQEEGSGVTLEFSVRDTGIGLNQDQMDSLFQPFTQAEEGTTRRYGGTGLGLSISRQLVTMMGGTIWVEGSIGEGSTFSFTARFDSPASGTGPEFSLPSPLKEGKVLLLGNRTTAVNILKEGLVSFGLEVFAMESLSKAKALLSADQVNAPMDFQMLFLDGNMASLPEFERPDNLKELLQGRSTPKMVLFVRQDMEETLPDSWKSGGHALLQEPFTPSELFHLIATLFEPKQEREEVQAGRGSHPAAEISGIRGARILLVEDNVINQQVARELLEQAGLHVTVASNGKDAMEFADKIDFDLVLMDIYMPEMDGLEAAALLRKDERFQDLPIISMSAQSPDAEREREQQAGMNDHVSKPVDPEKLFAVLAKWIAPKERTVDPGPEAEPERQTDESGSNEVQEGDSDQVLVEEKPWPKQLPGLNIPEGISRVLDNRDLYLELLQDFRNGFKDVEREIDQSLENDQMEELRFKVHNIKGVAGNLAAVNLYQSAARLEEAVKAGDRSEIHSHLVPFKADLDTVFQSIDLLEQANQEEPSEPSKSTEVDMNGISRTVLELEDCLTEFRLDADQVLEELKRRIAGSAFENLVEPLEKSIGEFNYEDALKSLRALSARLDIPLKGEGLS